MMLSDRQLDGRSTILMLKYAQISTVRWMVMKYTVYRHS